MSCFRLQNCLLSKQACGQQVRVHVERTQQRAGSWSGCSAQARYLDLIFHVPALMDTPGVLKHSVNTQRRKQNTNAGEPRTSFLNTPGRGSSPRATAAWEGLPSANIMSLLMRRGPNGKALVCALTGLTGCLSGRSWGGGRYGRKTAVQPNQRSKSRLGGGGHPPFLFSLWWVRLLLLGNVFHSP